MLTNGLLRREWEECRKVSSLIVKVVSSRYSLSILSLTEIAC